MKATFNKLYNELVEITDKIRPYYDVDKIRSYSVYIWTKDRDNDDMWNNVFDIESDGIVYYDKNHRIIAEAMPIIEEIQAKLKEIESIKEI